MKWVTRARPKTDRIACPWLIRRFIDTEAEILYVPAADVLAVAEAESARSFDAPGALYRPPRRAMHVRSAHRRVRPRRRPGAGATRQDRPRRRHRRPISTPIPLGLACWRSVSAASTSRMTTNASWSAPASCTTPCTPGVLVRWPQQPDPTRLSRQPGSCGLGSTADSPRRPRAQPGSRRTAVRVTDGSVICPGEKFHEFQLRQPSAAGRATS